MWKFIHVQPYIWFHGTFRCVVVFISDLITVDVPASVLMHAQLLSEEFVMVLFMPCACSIGIRANIRTSLDVKKEVCVYVMCNRMRSCTDSAGVVICFFIPVWPWPNFQCTYSCRMTNNVGMRYQFVILSNEECHDFHVPELAHYITRKLTWIKYFW